VPDRGLVQWGVEGAARVVEGAWYGGSYQGTIILALPVKIVRAKALMQPGWLHSQEVAARLFKAAGVGIFSSR
jgi:hypothetical protein